MFGNFFKPRPAVRTGQALYEQAAKAARQTDFYTQCAVPDQLEARFEMFTLHVWALLDVLKGKGEEAGEVAQALFDAYVKSLDAVLREQGIGDTSLAKKMKGLGQALYGRLKSLDDALGDSDPKTALGAYFARVLCESEAQDHQAGFGALADYTLRLHRALHEQGLTELLQVRVNWPKPIL